MLQVLEGVSVLLSLIYLTLLLKQKIQCWYFGIAASVLSFYLFYQSALYSESLLYIYYVVVGVYGYRLWYKNKLGNGLKVSNLPGKKLVLILLFGAVLSVVLGYLFSRYSGAKSPYLDAVTTSFSLIASFLEARKILFSWLLWIVVNILTLLLYYKTGLWMYFGLTIIYAMVSVVGYIKWRRSYRQEQNKELVIRS